MFVSQELHRRHEVELYDSLPIEAVRVTKRRQTLREAVQGLVRKGYSNLASFSLESAARTDGLVATFRRREKIEQGQPMGLPALNGLPETVRLLVEDIVAATGDPGSIPMWTRAIRGLGEQAVRYALADLRSEQHQRSAPGDDGAIKNAGAWLTTRLLALAKERGILIKRHVGETRRC